MNWLLYDAMNAADRIFWALLVREYGKDAGNRRYQLEPHANEDINVAARQMVALCDAWFNYYRGYVAAHPVY